MGECHLVAGWGVVSPGRTRREVLASAPVFGLVLAGCLGSPDQPDAADDLRDDAAPPDPAGAGNQTPAEPEVLPSIEPGQPEPDPDPETDAPADHSREVEDGLHPVRFTVNIRHPVGEELGRRPALGDLPADTGAIVVMYEDMSCRVCAQFERQIFPEFVDTLIRPGRVTLVARQFPRTSPWAVPATHALEAVYARDPGAFWRLRARYFEHQTGLDSGNIIDQTQVFLGEIGFDTDQVEGIISDVEQERFGPSVALDLAVRQRAGFFRTPSFFLFRNEEFVTRIVGNQAVRVFERALQL